MSDLSFPRWSAPLLGAVAGTYFGAQAAVEADAPIQYCLVGGAVLGALAGCLIFLVDPAGSKGIPEELTGLTPRVKTQSGVVGRFLAVVGLLICWFPVAGLITNLIGWFVNRRTHDWAKRCSKIGVMIGSIITVLFATILIVDSFTRS